MVVLGIDPGLATTGFGILKSCGNKLEVMDYGVIKTDAKEKLPVRLKKISENLIELISKYKPDMLAHEKIFFCKNVKTAMLVGQAIGVITLVCANAGLDIIEYTPLQVKQAISGYGFADKNQMGKMVQIVLKLKDIPKPDDAADALAVAFTHIGLNKYNDMISAQNK